MKNQIRLLVIAFAASFFLVSLPAATPAVAATSTAKMQEQIKTLHNKTRASHKKQALKANTCLQTAAKAQANAQAKAKKMFHQNLRPLLKKCKVSRVGENVAYGYTSAASVHKAWMNSPGHKKNILEGRYNRAGFGVTKGSDGKLYFAVVFGTK